MLAFKLMMTYEVSVIAEQVRGLFELSTNGFHPIGQPWLPPPGEDPERQQTNAEGVVD